MVFRFLGTYGLVLLKIVEASWYIYIYMLFPLECVL